jgi:hypothetical protein
MRRLWVTGEVEAPAVEVWDLLTDPARWPSWGPSVRAAAIDGGRLRLGATGTVSTVLGVTLPFEVTAFEEGRRWAWTVAGVGATDHRLDPLGPGRCRVGFGVPWAAAPYLAVCRLAIARIRTIATEPADA